MKTEYKKDLRHNYMVITDCEYDEAKAYCLKLLEHQTIEGILPVEQRRLDDEVLFYYDITSRQSMAAIFDKASLTKDRIIQLCTGIVNTIERADEYLLPEEDFILTPDTIYMEVVSDEVALCHLPGYNKQIKEQMSGLMEYLMNKVDYNDREAVLLVYRLYAVSREEGYAFEHLVKELKGSTQPFSDKRAAEPNVKIGSQKAAPQLSEDKQNKIPVMMEKLEREEEIPCYPLQTYLYTAACAAGGMLLLALGFITKFIYNTYGNQIDYIKLAALLLITFCVEGYVLKIIWDKKNKITRIITKCEYVDPRQMIDPAVAGAQTTSNKEQRVNLKQRDLTQHNQEEPEMRNKQDEFHSYKPQLSQNADRGIVHDAHSLGIQNIDQSNSQKVIHRAVVHNNQDYLDKDQKDYDSPTCLLNGYIPEAEGSPSMNGFTSCVLQALDDAHYQSIPITTFPFFIGKLKKNVDYCLEKDVVSRYHAKLLKENDAYFLMDMNSTNGTFVNGVSLKTYEKKEIKQGDEISFANIKYRLMINGI